MEKKKKVGDVEKKGAPVVIYKMGGIPTILSGKGNESGG